MLIPMKQLAAMLLVSFIGGAALKLKPCASKPHLCHYCQQALAMAVVSVPSEKETDREITFGTTDGDGFVCQASESLESYVGFERNLAQQVCQAIVDEIGKDSKTYKDLYVAEVKNVDAAQKKYTESQLPKPDDKELAEVAKEGMKEYLYDHPPNDVGITTKICRDVGCCPSGVTSHKADVQACKCEFPYTVDVQSKANVQMLHDNLLLKNN